MGKQSRNENRSKKIAAYTLIEVIISLGLISITLMAMFNSLNYIYRANLYIDDRLAIRDQTTFMIRYLSERLRNANPRSIISPGTNVSLPQGGSAKLLLEWHAVGRNTIYRLLYQKSIDHPYFPNQKYSRLLLMQSDDAGDTWYLVVLSYPGADIKDITAKIDPIYHDKITMLDYCPVTIRMVVDSTRHYGGRPLVRNIVKYLNVLVVN